MYVKTFESYNRGEIIFKSNNNYFFGPIIGYQKDFDNNDLSLMNGYQTGTIIIGDDMQKDKGITDYSSPFHKGQVISDDNWDDVEEVDFKYHRSISDDIIRTYLNEYVDDNYNDSAIIKTYYH